MYKKILFENMKLHKRLFFSFIAFFFLSLSIQAQVTVSGTVVDENGLALPGVTVLEVGTDNGTITDLDGRYRLMVKQGSTVSFSYVGYNTYEIVANSSGDFSINLSPDTKLLEEVVVTGYAAQQKKDLTGAVGVVNVSELKQVPSNNITTQLQGRVSGVSVGGDGSPGSIAKIRIRGFNSFSGANDPLYIVDGVPTTDISTINPNDIQSVSVLKDAGAASIYGSRAANGVIIVTTKNGQNKGTTVTYDMYHGYQTPSIGNLKLLSAQEYADLQWLVYRNDGTDEEHPLYGKSSNPKPTLPSWASNTNWVDILTRNGAITNHDIGLSGGNESSKFFAGFNYFNQDGIIIHNFSNRMSARLNSEFKAAKGRLTIGENFTISLRNGLPVARNGSEGSPFARLYMMQPIIPARIPAGTTIKGISRTFVEGEYGGTGLAPRLGNISNVLADLERDSDDRLKDTRAIGSIFADFKILEGLNFRSTMGGSFYSGNTSDWSSSTYERAENQATSSFREESYSGSDWVWTNSLTLNKTFGAHKLLAVAGYEAITYEIGKGVGTIGAGYFSSAKDFRTISNAATIASSYSWLNTPTTLASTFLRADYSNNDRYYLSGTIRRDGSSRFGTTNKYGIFPSISAGVRLSDFIGSNGILNDLKVRGGYGTMGNQAPLSPFNQFSLFGGGVSDSNYDINGSGSTSAQGFRPTNIGNPDAKWETQITANVGFDAELFDSKLQMTVDLYQKKSLDLLVQAPLPAIYGAATAPFINIGDMRNRGIDLMLNYKNRVNSDFDWSAGLVFSRYKNEIVKFTDNVDYFETGGGRIAPFNRNAVGKPLSSMYGYKVLGLFQNQAEVDNSPKQDGAEPGFFKYADLNGDKKIDDKDRDFIGDPNPDFTYGLNFGANYKNFDLAMFWFGSQGNDILNYTRWWVDFWPSFQNQKSAALLYDSWTPDRPDKKVPKASNKSNFSNNTVMNSYYIEDGSFLRLRNLQIGYNLNSLATKVGITKARIYLQGLNLLTFTKYSGIDPDINNGWDAAFGTDFGNYPLTRQYIAGLNITF